MKQQEWKEIFSNNLIDILEDRGMSQAQLARDSGLSVSRVSEYINRNATPTIFALINIADALDMDIGELVDFGDTISG